MPNSWLYLQQQNRDHALHRDLANTDSFGARDCGWVEQMRPFIREFSQPNDTVLDPFSGFASTLVAAGLEHRKSIGIEIEESRYRISQRRLDALDIQQATLIHGDCNVVASSLPSVDLIISSLPYFGCGLESHQSNQLYSAASYGSYLNTIRDILKNLKAVLKPSAYIITMIENVRVGPHFIPQAWDVARLLSERFNFVEERIIIYDKLCEDTSSSLSNRAHEYVLIAKNSAHGIDLHSSVELLQKIQHQYPEVLVIGSFAQWLTGAETVPSDIDVYLPFDVERITRLMEWLDAQQFQITRWGSPVAKEMIELASAGTPYFRAERLDADGRLIRLDVAFSRTPAIYAALAARAVWAQGVRCIAEPVDLEESP